MNKELHVAKTLWRDMFATVAMADATTFLDHIEHTPNPEIKWPLWTAFITTYARPFTSNKDMGMISLKAIPPNLIELHVSLVTARNHLYSHTNPLETLDDGIEANQLFIIKKSRQVQTVEQTLCPDDSEIPRIKALLKVVSDDLIKRTESGKQRIAAKLADAPDGQYKFTYPKTKK